MWKRGAFCAKIMNKNITNIMKFLRRLFVPFTRALPSDSVHPLLSTMFNGSPRITRVIKFFFFYFIYTEMWYSLDYSRAEEKFNNNTQKNLRMSWDVRILITSPLFVANEKFESDTEKASFWHILAHPTNCRSDLLLRRRQKSCSSSHSSSQHSRIFANWTRKLNIPAHTIDISYTFFIQFLLRSLLKPCRFRSNQPYFLLWFIDS